MPNDTFIRVVRESDSPCEPPGTYRVETRECRGATMVMQCTCGCGIWYTVQIGKHSMLVPQLIGPPDMLDAPKGRMQ